MATPTPTIAGLATGCTLAQYALLKQLPETFLKTLGLSDISYMGAPAVRIPYHAADGSLMCVQFRTAVQRTSSGDAPFKWRSGDKPQLYGLNRLTQARNAGYAVMVEGPSDAQTLWHHDIPAVGLPSARWTATWDQHLSGIPELYVVVERDSGGDKVLRALERSTLTDRLKIIDLGAHKDASALFLDDPAQFRTRWDAAMRAALTWKDREQRARRLAADAAWAKCEALAKRPDILQAFAQSAQARGVIGEARTIKLLYLVVTSRVLDRIVSAVLKGPSSAGKSYLMHETLAHFPDGSHMLLTGMSEKALAYGDDPLSHRMLVVSEMAGADAKFQSYLIRTLLSEGYLAYQTVEKTPDGLRARTIRREGPTGLLITTTAIKIHPENETRLLSLTVDDTPEHTRQVLIGRAENQQVTAVPDEWLQLQEWLALTDNVVAIPFATDLAKSIPPVATRLRRDFNAVLGLIAAHAVLHKVNRSRNAHGAIVATEADYTAVRELVSDLLAEGVGTAVPPQVRETVEAVQRLTQNHPLVSVAALAKELKLDASTASRRAAHAEALGHLTATKDGRTKQLMVAMPLPGDQNLLPASAALFPPASAPQPNAALSLDEQTARCKQHLAALARGEASGWTPHGGS